MATKLGDVLFVDTNVLLTASDESRPGHPEALGLLAGARRSGLHLGLSGQILREYLAVATRPVSQNGLGLSPAEALVNINEFRRLVLLYEENDAVSRRLCRLVRDAGVQGKRVHDANVAATMLTHGLATLITDNPEDFAGFAGIDILSTGDAFRAVTGATPAGTAG